VLNNRLFRTISFQLTALFCLIIALCLMALLATTYLTTSSALRGQLQTEIRNQLNTYVEEAKTDGVASIVQDIEERARMKSVDTGFYFLSDAAGKKLAGNIEGMAPVDGWREGGIGNQALAGLGQDSDEDHQIWGQGTHLDDGSYLFVGQDSFRLLTAQESIVQSFLWSAVVAFLLAGVAGYILSSGFLRRIDDINTTSLAIMDGKLKQRIPMRGTADELDRLSNNLNRLFDSNEALLNSLKQVSANIAHDLRTPLTRLRQGLEEAKAKSAQQKAVAIESAIVESDQLLVTFAALLRIAQIESGSRRAGFKQINMSRIFQRVADAYSAVAEDDGKQLVTHFAPDLQYFGDEELLLQMTVNLVENAIRHTPTGTTIVFSLEAGTDGLRGCVADSGPGIPQGEREKVFEHFYRLETSRTSDGSGLGLALVAAIAKLHGIQLALEDNLPGLKVVLEFPPQN
jgi:signal transduction histidine kinase